MINEEKISFADFQKLDIRIGEIKTAEDIPGADKLYRLTVDLGFETRELVAGVKAYYPKEELIGKKVLVLANLEPRVIKGVESRGMILCAHNEDRSKLVFTTPVSDILPGAKVS
ncbi:methionine--tRNA ligase subunit beta [Candidatus Saganbacteria bacterium]|nr:methionine--tRNA ligase subunit beta [Candidatus Saganbacteria bacterium]